ncbi:hypothetical protein HP439_17580 [Sphingobacterium shayense]|uniref:GTPase-associated system all-helical protein GASH n=1 Tax=Sphingobacterium shayense TaxID=626343 RepID=UPI001555C618|nr:GTPase-associated system all-helical protein GASH [Sphingobacterium shayense]NQD72538.1 hypothetical protein [Sphingobacterium shayense]
MTDIAKHIRIFNSNPNDEFVTKRTTAINSIEAVIRKMGGINDVFDFANSLLSALDDPYHYNETVSSVAVPALKKSSTSFVADEESLQIITCALLATVQHLNKTKPYAHKPSPEFILASSLWNGLSFQHPIAEKEKLEVLRTELQKSATRIATDISVNSRQRKQTKTRSSIAVPAEETFANFIDATETSYGKLIDAFRINAILDREELDILWWALGGWSELCSIQMSQLNPVQSCLVGTIEIGKLLHRFPSKAHVHLACRFVDQTKEYSVSQLIDEMGDLKDKIINVLPIKKVESYSKIFPVSNLLLDPGDVSGDKRKYSLNEWSSRLIVEISLDNVNKFAE